MPLSPSLALAFLRTSRRHLLGEYRPKIERCLDLLTDQDIWWRPDAGSNSIGNLVLHLSGNARQWIVAGVDGQTDLRDRDYEFAEQGPLSTELLRARMASALGEVEAALVSLEQRAAQDPALLLERRTIQGMDVSVLEAIYHVVEHFSQHTGQILWITKMRTGSDLGFWVVDAEGARPNWG
ncbi:MAG: DinB family protein [Gemmatimonadota bacterium]|nr:DUF1572 family protein [Gemmatimonadota bacterium]